MQLLDELKSMPVNDRLTVIATLQDTLDDVHYEPTTEVSASMAQRAAYARNHPDTWVSLNDFEAGMDAEFGSLRA
jgi:hypothetical protein